MKKIQDIVFADLIDVTQKITDYKQENFAEKIGLSYSQFKRWKSGKTPFPRSVDHYTDSILNILKNSSTCRSGNSIEQFLLLLKEKGYTYSNEKEWLDFSIEEAFTRLLRYTQINSMATKENSFNSSNEFMDSMPSFSVQEMLHMSEFLARSIYSQKPISKIFIATHAGGGMLFNDRYEEVFKYFREHQIPVELLVNEKAAIAHFMDHFKDNRNYLNDNKWITEWNHSCNTINTNITMRITGLPVLHRTCIVFYQDGSSDIYIKPYIYGKHVGITYGQVITQDSSIHSLYLDEYAYLWKEENHLSYTYEEFVER